MRGFNVDRAPPEAKLVMGKSWLVGKRCSKGGFTFGCFACSRAAGKKGTGNLDGDVRAFANASVTMAKFSNFARHQNLDAHRANVAESANCALSAAC